VIKMEIIIESEKYGNQVVLIDDEDAALISRLSIGLSKSPHTFYVWYSKGPERGAIHRLIMGKPKGMLVDHKNGNGLDNRKQNLRVSTRQQNAFNRHAHISKITKFKGIKWSTTRKMWSAQITVSGKNTHGGEFFCEVNAAIAYNELAKKHHGDFCKLNTITKEDEVRRIKDEAMPIKGFNRNNSSGYRGVTWSKERKLWVAQITINRTNKNLGRYVNVFDAANAYVSKYKEVYGHEPYQIK
jgi:hypothetical protein